MIRRLVRTYLAVVLFAFATSMLAHADNNLVVNGGFETGDFTGWTLSGDTLLVGVCDVSTCPYNYMPYQGTYAAYFGPVGDTASISQNIATTPGTEYSLSFYLANPQGGTPNYFQVTFGNSSFSFTNFGAAFNWQQFTLTTLATGTETPLQFTFRNDPGYFFLDDVIVSQVGGTAPEPGTFILFGTGALALVGAARRKLGR